VARILVLGGAGEMGSMAVTDLTRRTEHEIAIGDTRTEAAGALLRELGAPERVVRVDVDDPESLQSAFEDAEVVLNATLMRYNVAVTDAAIAARVHLVDLGSYYPETLQQLDRSAAAADAGCRIVIGCGVAPGLTNILARLGADSLDTVESIRMYSYGTHPLSTSPGIVVTRFDAAAVPSLVLEHGRLVERPSFSDEEQVVFPDYGEQTVYLVPHPEPVTLPRYLEVENAVIKLGYPPEERQRLAVLLELGFDREEEFQLDGVAVSPRRFAAAYVGSRGIPDGFRSANAKQLHVDGVRDGRPVTLVYDFSVEQVGRSASSVVTGTVAAIATDLVARGSGTAGVNPPEGVFDPREFVHALAERGLSVSVRELSK
jgi:saccharopine dehydrogenase-like NADP-dependent oxidoreductase